MIEVLNSKQNEDDEILLLNGTEKERLELATTLGTSDSIELDVIHRTRTSSVYYHPETNLVIKVAKKNSDTVLFENEGNMLALACGNHLNVPELLKVIQNDKVKLFVMEYTGLDLVDLYSKLTIERVQLMIRDLPTTLNKLHDLSIFHRDIKPENVTFNGEKWSFIDFGLSTQSPNLTYFVGTIPFLLPFFGNGKLENQWDPELVVKCNDYYALSLMLLTVFVPVVSYHCDKCIYFEGTSCKHLSCKYIRIDLRKLQDFELYARQSFLTNEAITRVMTICRAIVLTTVDVQFWYLTWNIPKKTAFYNNGKIYNTTMDLHKIETLWKDITTVSN